MGDWAVTTHWSAARPRMPVARDFIDERWAARVGRVGHALWQLETVQKYGFYAGAWPADGAAVVGAQDGYDYLLDRGDGVFFAGWNYVLGTAPRLFAEAATLLGDAQVLSLSPSHQLLALRTSHRFARAHATWRLYESHLDPSPAARVIEALAASRPRSAEATELVVGLYTREFGYVHTGRLAFESGSVAAAEVALRVTGSCNPLTAERVIGPYAGSIYMEREPSIALPIARWPFPEAASR